MLQASPGFAVDYCLALIETSACLIAACLTYCLLNLLPVQFIDDVATTMTQ